MPGTSRSSPGLVGRLLVSLFFLVFFAMGLVVTTLLLRSILQESGGHGGPSPWPALLFLAIPLLFVAVGLGGIYLTWRSGNRPTDAVSLALARSAGVSWLPAPQGGDPDIETLEPLLLKPRQTRLGTFFGVLLLAAFWNGITGVFVWQIVSAFRQGNGDWGAALFLSIFVLVGLVLLLAIPYQFLALWNPRPHLTLGRGTLRVGDRVDVEWRFTGRPGRIRRLRLTFEGREEATYPSGRSSSTAREVFHTVEILDTTEPLTIPAGAARLTLPADTMHSFAAAHNRIVWSLKVGGEIRHWPDVNEEFEVAVLPQTVGGRW